MKEIFLSWFLNVVTINLKFSRGGIFLLDGKPYGCDVEEHIATKVEVNPQIFSTLKNEKSVLSMKPGEDFGT